MRKIVVISIIAIMTASVQISVASVDQQGEPFTRTLHKIYLQDDATLRELAQYNLDIVRSSVDGSLSVEAFLNEDEAELLRALGYRAVPTPNLAREMFLKLKSETEGTDDPLREYHTYDEMLIELQAIAAANPSICELHNVGPTVQRRALWFMNISDNVGVEEDELEFKYISTMHGDEPVGTEMCMYFINLLVDEYGIDPELTELVNETEIWIMPLMNPDGNSMGSRYNANGVDLNRNFPDRVDDPVNTTAGREIETADVMNWNFGHQPVFSANFHTGALVANYPWDHGFDPQANAVYCDNHDVVLAASETYSWNNSPMWNNNFGSFTNGTVNGADWYQISGGMQDWNYHWMGDMDITMELSNTAWPSPSAIPGLWDDNRESMIAYMQFAHRGIRGVVTDAVTSLPLLADVKVVGRDDFVTFTDPDVGDYHSTLMPGTYDLDITRFGYWPAHLTDVVVLQGTVTREDVALQPADQMTFTGTLHHPVGGGLSARLTLVDTPYNPTETNVNGEFTFADVYEGEYTLRIMSLSDGSIIEFPIILSAWMTPLELWGPISIFYDGFEAGLGSWNAEGSWGTSGNSYSGSLSAADSPSGEYGNNLNISLTNNGSFDLTEYDYAALSYYITYNCETNYDSLFAEISTDGSNWQKVNYHNSKQDWWTLEIFDLDEQLSATNLQVRYRLQTDGSVTRDGGFIDEVRLSVASITPITQEVTIALAPYGTPIQIPAAGGSFDYNIEASNSGSTSVNADVWCDVTLPSSSQYGPTLGPVNVTLGAGVTIDRDRTQTVPGAAPAGDYTYHAYIGDYPNVIYSQDSFHFEKIGVDDSGLGDWLNTGEEFSGSTELLSALPQECILAQNYPNPFNPVTMIHFALPEAGVVNLKVYNTAGQLITTLVNGYRETGWHAVSWNASDLATGLYVYRLEAGGSTFTQKAVLIK
ncbi:hypothetical protein CEE37_11330 [candidate division LCP-89 bacterium B3_LCP]|uniref:Peptidase M14 domain-containing protein n=1 Tax=candidate division LCP-89 bacterium B3_LCP TaxID=2012998 RepID=A0A532UY80_UNCL8|nr:MAG: hypothetical protein CEE37_11330 [candidate division LCP-89 bacterium B3_LCP]